MMVTSSLQTIAPQRDIDGSLFLVNRTYRISEDYVPQVVQADVSGSLRSMRPEAAAALEEMFAACKEEAGVTLVTVSGYRSYQKQKNIYNNKLKSVGGSEERRTNTWPGPAPASISWAWPWTWASATPARD